MAILIDDEYVALAIGAGVVIAGAAVVSGARPAIKGIIKGGLMAYGAGKAALDKADKVLHTTDLVHRIVKGNVELYDKSKVAFADIVNGLGSIVKEARSEVTAEITKNHQVLPTVMPEGN
ncbi:MAG: hypothetical protein SFH39_14410 [Candidatus Magnetobacterium sp. LHC-1]|nr:hypothetical protein [Nitrospirota bacterium]